MELANPEPGTMTPPQLFYRDVMDALGGAGIECLVGGAYAFAIQTRVERVTKDFDLFVRPSDVSRVIDAARALGHSAAISSPHWLAKIESDRGFIDVIFSSGNGVATVDDAWFDHARHEQVLGMTCAVCPPEETIWSKSFVMERSRFDGADVAHILLARADSLDWDRLVRRFGPHWRVLLSHLVLFGFIYPGERALIPSGVLRDLVGRLLTELEEPTRNSKVCQGTLLSRAQYLVDIDEWGYEDARVTPRGAMTEEQLRVWTAAIDN